MDKPLEPFTNIKLKLDFCRDAHCFEDIYAKVISTKEYLGQPAIQLRITSMEQKDREILEKWLEEAV
jgi:hypothetical protein